MKIEIFKEKLEQSLNIIERLARKKPNLPILGNVLLEADKNFLKLSATNLESSIIWWILTRVETGGKVCLPAVFLRSIIGFLKEEKIILRTERYNLIIETKNQTTQIQGVNPEDFPIIPKIEKEDFIELNSQELEQGINQVVNIPTLSQIRPEISGIFFNFRKDKLKIVGTDSFRLAEKTIDLPQKIKKDFSFILPQYPSKELLNILALRPGAIKLYFNKNQIMVERQGEETNYPQIQFSSRIIDGEYPNYQEIIPKKYTVEISLNKEEFQNQVKKAGLFSGKISEIKLTAIPRENKLKIFSQNPEFGRSEAYLPSKIETKLEEEIEVSFNHRFLIEGLLNIKTEEVVFSLSNKEGPATLRGIDDDNYIYILMPIKAS